MTIGISQSSTGYPKYQSVAELKTIALQSGATVETVAYTAGWQAGSTRPSGGAVYNIVTAVEFTAITGLFVPDEVTDHTLSNGFIAMYFRSANEMKSRTTLAVAVADGTLLNGDSINIMRPDNINSTPNSQLNVK